MELVKECAVCSKLFIARRNYEKYCSRKCCYEGYELNRLQKKNKGEDKPSELERLLKEAREHNMSYGKYVAMIEYEKVAGGR